MIAQAIQAYRGLTFDRVNSQVLIDTTPLPEELRVQEIGVSSAPLLSASYFIGARCKPYNDDYMQCKDQSNGRGELDCLREGRKVTRCASSVYVVLQRTQEQADRVLQT